MNFGHVSIVTKVTMSHLPRSSIFSARLSAQIVVTTTKLSLMSTQSNGPVSYSKKEPGSSVIFIQFYTQGSIEWR